MDRLQVIDCLARCALSNLQNRDFSVTSEYLHSLGAWGREVNKLNSYHGYSLFHRDVSEPLVREDTPSTTGRRHAKP